MLELAAVAKSYERGGVVAPAVGPISLSVPPRQFVSILGPSGCGKSTLLKCVAGLMVPSEGTIALDGRPVRGVPDSTVYVFQEYSRSLFPWLRLLGNVVFPLSVAMPSGDARAKALHYISMVGLKGFESHYPWEMSGGMQQRAAIARALVKEPNFLLMDEPFGSVDAQTRTQLEDMLLALWTAKPRTVLFVTHDIEEAIYLSDRVLVMSGRPGCFVDDIAIELPRPRSQIESKENHRFADYRRRLYGLLADPSAERADASS
jgi:NitT/TauT family transport system ATP-binding protein